jgi:hypothetical protein
VRKVDEGNDAEPTTVNEEVKQKVAFVVQRVTGSSSNCVKDLLHGTKA